MNHPHEEAEAVVDEFSLVETTVVLACLTAAACGSTLLAAAAWWPKSANLLFISVLVVCQLYLLAGFFMHLKFEKAWKYALCLPPCVLAFVFLAVVAPDVVAPVWAAGGWK
ncbi:MAG: cytochrome C oxidase subunit IV family protein [Planctomycetia bacterium]